MRYMLDTNICIYLGHADSPSVREKFAALRRGDVVMSVVTYAELRHGVERDNVNFRASERALNLLIAEVSVIAFDADAAGVYGRLAVTLPRQKRNAIDCMIAAHAISLDVTLVTNNERDFVAYAEAGGLRVENWVAG